MDHRLWLLAGAPAFCGDYRGHFSGYVKKHAPARRKLGAVVEIIYVSHKDWHSGV